jgi:SAM-dependent methyltransferase
LRRSIFWGKSVLDVGSDTGRVIAWLQRARPDLVVRGIEPVDELRKVNHAKGIGKDVLVAGNALALGDRAGEFDLVCEFGVLHHIEQPERAVAEILRVSRSAVFISDSNNVGSKAVPWAVTPSLALDLSRSIQAAAPAAGPPRSPLQKGTAAFRLC